MPSKKIKNFDHEEKESIEAIMLSHDIELFKKELKNYIYIFSYIKDSIDEEYIQNTFDLLVRTLNKTSPKYEYGFTILPNYDQTVVNEKQTNDIFISYNSEFLIDEKALAKVIRVELMQTIKNKDA